MAWNPEPEVAVARDAAKKLNDAAMCVVIFVDKRGENIGMASYGKNKELCKSAGSLGKHLLAACHTWEGDGD